MSRAILCFMSSDGGNLKVISSRVSATEVNASAAVHDPAHSLVYCIPLFRSLDRALRGVGAEGGCLLDVLSLLGSRLLRAGTYS